MKNKINLKQEKRIRNSYVFIEKAGENHKLDEWFKNYIKDEILNLISKKQYNRILISEDLSSIKVFEFGDKDKDESHYCHEIIIDDRKGYHSWSSIYNTLKESINESINQRTQTSLKEYS